MIAGNSLIQSQFRSADCSPIRWWLLSGFWGEHKKRQSSREWANEARDALDRKVLELARFLIQEANEWVNAKAPLHPKDSPVQKGMLEPNLQNAPHLSDRQWDLLALLEENKATLTRDLLPSLGVELSSVRKDLRVLKANHLVDGSGVGMHRTPAGTAALTLRT